MLSDLDELMDSRGIDAIIVPMHEALHASFRWITRGAKLTKGYAVKKRGGELLLVAYPMERDEAAATGLRTKLVHDFDHEAIFRNATSPAAAYAEFFDRVLASVDAHERVAFFGNVPAHLYLGIGDELRERGRKIVAGGDDLVQLARKRKEPHEVAAIEAAARRTERIIGDLRTMLRGSEVDDGVLMHGDRPLLLGDLKTWVSQAISIEGLVEDHETILSQGRDAGIPHSRGDASAPVRTGVPIVLDIFPADKATGYFCDITRTFCVGPVPARLREIYDAVREVFDLCVASVRPGTKAREYQALTCDFFEKRGYPTIRSNPATLTGYVHSLGHGVGLDIHEKPFFSLIPSNQDLIEEGDIITIEPGLYFPDEEIGVRIEDTFVVTEDGVRSLCQSTRDLEV